MGSGFGTRIRRLREQADLSQETLAGLAGISREWLAKIESGKNPRLSVVIRVAKALATCLPEVTIAYLFEGYRGIPPGQPAQARLSSDTRLADIVGPTDTATAFTVNGRLLSARTPSQDESGQDEALSLGAWIKSTNTSDDLIEYLGTVTSIATRPLPTQMADHWWQRPGRRPDRELYHWHMLFHNQPVVRELAARAQDRLMGLPGLDMVPIQWLHLTTYIVGFVDEIREPKIEAMLAEARRLLARIPPIPVRLGRIFYHPEAVTLPIEPTGVLAPVLDAVRTASESVGCAGHTDTDPWRPHISVAYSNGVSPAAPIIAALGRSLTPVEVTIRSVSLVAQTQVGRTWQWRPVAEVPLLGQTVPVHPS